MVIKVNWILNQPGLRIAQIKQETSQSKPKVVECEREVTPKWQLLRGINGPWQVPLLGDFMLLRSPCF
jgi:hypothetical protein